MNAVVIAPSPQRMGATTAAVGTVAGTAAGAPATRRDADGAAAFDEQLQTAFSDAASLGESGRTGAYSGSTGEGAAPESAGGSADSATAPESDTPSPQAAPDPSVAAATIAGLAAPTSTVPAPTGFGPGASTRSAFEGAENTATAAIDATGSSDAATDAPDSTDSTNSADSPDSTDATQAIAGSPEKDAAPNAGTHRPFAVALSDVTAAIPAPAAAAATVTGAGGAGSPSTGVAATTPVPASATATGSVATQPTGLSAAASILTGGPTPGDALPSAPAAEGPTAKPTASTGENTGTAATPQPADPASATSNAHVELTAPIAQARPVAAAAELAATPAPRTGDQHALVPQLVRPLAALVASAPGRHELSIAVTPEALGPVTVRAHLGTDGIRIELFTPSDAGRDAVRAILGDLRRDLASTGMSAQLDLSAGDQPQAGPGDGREQRWHGAEQTAPARHEQARVLPTTTTPTTGRTGQARSIDVLA